MLIKKLHPLSKKIVLVSGFYYTCVNALYFIFSRKFNTQKLFPNQI